jgi:hypothetical protein
MNDILLAECDHEPLHIPGAVQPHGALVVSKADTWAISHASANLSNLIGTDTAAALGQPLADLLGKEFATLLRHEVLTRRGNPAGIALETGLAGEPIRVLPHHTRNGGSKVRGQRSVPRHPTFSPRTKKGGRSRLSCGRLTGALQSVGNQRTQGDSQNRPQGQLGLRFDAFISHGDILKVEETETTSVAATLRSRPFTPDRGHWLTTGLKVG